MPRTYSLSERIFLAVNARIGTFPRLDGVMIAIANLGIVLLFIGTLGYSFVYGYLLLFLFVSVGASVLALSLHWLFSLFVPLHRPIRVFPHITQLITPLQDYKSFPSDHTTVAVILSLVPFVYGGWVISVFCALCVVGIGVSRIYVGVHMPRDIIGGVVSGIICSIVVLRLALDMIRL